MLGGCAGDDAGPGGDAKMGGSITVVQGRAPDSLDPGIAYSPQAAQAHWLVYPGLVTYKHEEGKEGSKLIAAAAEKLPDVSNAGTTYRFRLRKGLVYSDGTRAKASDFLHAVRRARKLRWPGRRFLDLISDVKADDPSRRITIHLVTADSRLPYVLAFPALGLVPGATPMKDLSRKPPPGLGAYRFAGVSRTSYALVKNKRFKLPGIPEGNVDRIAVKTVKSPAAQAQDVIDGRVDSMNDVAPAVLLPELRSKYKDRYKEKALDTKYFMFLDTRKAPFDELKVRQAVNYGFDKRAAARLSSGLLQPTCNYLPPNMVGYDQPDPCKWGDPNEAPNVEKARQLIKNAGETGTPVDVWAPDSEPGRRVGEYYVDVLHKIGLKARLVSTRSRAQTGFDSETEHFPHPSDFFSALRLPDPKVGRLEAQIQADDPSKTTDESKELDQYVSGPERAYLLAYGDALGPSFLSERMDFENCDVVSPVYRDDWSQYCLK